MIKILRTILSDFRGLTRACGPAVAARWLAAVAARFPQCVKARNLQPADRAMGAGPFPVRLRDARARLFGEQVVSGIRELWVRDVYLDGGRLTIPPGGVVVDLGANMGNFTALALGHGPDVRCVSVEGDPRMLAKLRQNLDANGWLGRALICEQFIGGRTTEQDRIAREVGAGGPAYVTEDEFVRRYDLTRIDLLKCDIEGSEFDLLGPGSLLLQMSRQVAVEVHAWGGDVPAFVRSLEDEGFDVRAVYAADGSAIVSGARRTAPV